MEENRLKQGGTFLNLPITNACFCFPFQNILLLCALMNTTLISCPVLCHLFRYCGCGWAEETAGSPPTDLSCPGKTLLLPLQKKEPKSSCAGINTNLFQCTFHRSTNPEQTEEGDKHIFFLIFIRPTRLQILKCVLLCIVHHYFD